MFEHGGCNGNVVAYGACICFFGGGDFIVHCSEEIAQSSDLYPQSMSRVQFMKMFLEADKTLDSKD
jgi:hypothetical protein